MTPSGLPEFAPLTAKPRYHSYFRRCVGQTGADLSRAELSGVVDLSHTSCVNTDFTYANLSDALFFNTDLTGANFTRANLTNATFSRPRLCATIFFNSILLDTDLENAVELDYLLSLASREQPPLLCGTKLPSHMVAKYQIDVNCDCNRILPHLRQYHPTADLGYMKLLLGDRTATVSNAKGK